MVDSSRAYLKQLLISFLLVFLVFGSFILFPTIGIDTEAIILDQERLLIGWESISRIGLVLIKRAFFSVGFNQMHENSLMIITLAFSLTFLVKKFNFSNYIFPLAFLGFPITYTQIYFQLQNFEVSLAFGLLVGVLYYFNRKKSTSWLLIASLTIGFATSIYQSMIGFAITFLAFLMFNQESQTITFKNLLTLGMPLPLGMVVYKMLNLFLNQTPQSAYLTMAFGNKLSILAFLLIGGLALLTWFVTQRKSWSLVQSLSFFAFLSSPLYLVALTGNFTFRAMFPALPFVFAVLADRLVKGEKLKYLLYSLVGLSLGMTLFLQYQEYHRYQKDQAIAKQIISKIPSSDYRLQFVGKYQVKPLINIPYEPVNYSFFSWDPYDNQERSDRMLELMGAKFVHSDPTQNSAAYETYKNLPNYPSEGSIVVNHDEKVVVVKFSERLGG